MSSSDNQIYEEIKNLLSRDVSAEKVEKLLTLLDSSKPSVNIDRGFQKDLKKSLLVQSTSRRPVFFSYIPLIQKISLVSAVCASFLMVFTFWKLLFPHLDSLDKQKILLPESAPMDTPQGIESKNMEKVQNTVGAGESRKEISTKIDAVDEEIQAIMGDLSDLSLGTPSQKQALEKTIPSPSSENPSLARSALPVTTFSLSIPLSSMDMQATPTPQDTDIQSEISSIVSDINSIVSNVSLNANIALPEYPEQIAVYQKSGTFTDDEILTQRGQNIVTVLMHTEQDANILIDELKKKAGGKKIKGSGKLVYEVLVKNELTSFLVPKIQFSLVSGKTISVSVVSGVE
ncbi:hypothetical protein KBB25_02965 [Candidatus Gracilibacteria bacterium]|nr:hypothetical protein [Candidatus Gracilibacteria bacterium]